MANCSLPPLMCLQIIAMFRNLGLSNLFQWGWSTLCLSPQVCCPLFFSPEFRNVAISQFSWWSSGLVGHCCCWQRFSDECPGLRTSYNPASCFLAHFLCGILRAYFTFRDASVLGMGLVNFWWIMKRDSLWVESRHQRPASCWALLIVCKNNLYFIETDEKQREFSCNPFTLNHYYIASTTKNNLQYHIEIDKRQSSSKKCPSNLLNVDNLTFSTDSKCTWWKS